MKEYKEELLKNLGVYELRELARSIGVSSPTTKKRKELEQGIIKISTGKALPEVRKNKKGRPPKSITKMESVLDIFVPKELLEITLNKKMDANLEDVIKFASNSIYDTEDYQLSGFLRKTLSGYYYFKNYGSVEECVSIPTELVPLYDLIEGDKLVALARKSPTENFYILSKLISINNNEIADKREVFNTEGIVLGHSNLIGFEGVNEGENILLVTENIKAGVEKIKKAFSNLSPEYSFVIAAPSVSTYTKLLLEKDANIELIYTLVEDHPAHVYDMSINALNHLNALLREGRKVVFVAFDIFGLIKEIENFFTLENQKQTHQERIEAVRVAKKIMNYGKVLDTGASVTVFAHCLESEMQEDMFKNELAKLSDKMFRM